MQSNMSYQAASQSSAIEINKVLKNTYMLLAMTLAFSAVTAGISMAVGVSHLAALGMWVAAIVLMFVINKNANKPSAILMVFAMTGLLGAALGPTLTVYAGMANGGSLIMQALGGTALIFFALSGYALTTKKDFSFLGGMLFVGLIVAVIAMIANIFFQIPALSMAISAVVILIMSGLILFDTSRIIHGGERNYVLATVSLYLNIYNIFVHLLHLLGVFGGDD